MSRISPLAVLLLAGAAQAEPAFNRIASFDTSQNGAGAAENSAEIIAVSEDGQTLVYTDSPSRALGRIDIRDPTSPLPLGSIALPGEPTAVSLSGRSALVAINTSTSYTAPSGRLLAVDIDSGNTLADCDLGGQPDSVALAPDGSFLAVAIENERDEDAGSGRVPQLPAGFVVKLPVEADLPVCDAAKAIAVTGLSEIAPEDPEPEFVDINTAGEIVVTLQENNHLVVIGADGTVLSHFSAGAVDIAEIDTLDERGALIFDGSQQARLREPDAVKWVDSDHFAIANEGDMDGGSRGWSLFRKDGTMVYDSGNDFEHAVIQAGHYPDKRSDAKGVEPEGLAFAEFGGVPLLFVLAERASVVGVYDLSDLSAPVLRQLLPSGIGPEGAVAIPARGLLATANEADLIEDKGPRAHVMLYKLAEGAADYPTITSQGADELIGWGALSGLVASGESLYAVNDSFYGYQPRIFEIDASDHPARIIRAIDVTRAGRPAQKLDLEGITTDGEGGFWLVSEGRTGRLIPHALLQVDTTGEIQREVAFPPELLAVEKRWAAEGVTRIGEVLWIAIQRRWGDDPENTVKLVAYNIADDSWGAVRYPTEPAEKGWVGLSEIVADGDWVYLIERDNQIGEQARVKQITRVAISALQPAPLGAEFPLVGKEHVRDLIPDLRRWNGYVVDKVESLAIADGRFYLITDNDGVDDSSGETHFWSVPLP